jgi:hypothetical protein
MSNAVQEIREAVENGRTDFFEVEDEVCTLLAHIDKLEAEKQRLREGLVDLRHRLGEEAVGVKKRTVHQYISMVEKILGIEEEGHN